MNVTSTMSSSGNSPYPSSLPLADMYCPQVSTYVDNFFDSSLPIPEITPYDLSLHGFYVTDDCRTDLNSDILYHSAFSHLTPVSEPCSDMQDCDTPLSLQPPFDFNNAPRTSQRPGVTNINLDIVSAVPRSSPRPLSNHASSWVPDRVLKGDELTSQPTPATSPRVFHRHSTSNTSDATICPSTKRQYTPIAPNPAGVRQMHCAKRSISSDDDFEHTPVFKRVRSAPPSPNINVDMTAEDELLLRLKDDENLTWREIQSRFQVDMNKAFQIPALQMRLKRLRERMRTWSDMDIQALRMAHDYWNNSKFEIIAAKMTEFGAHEKWSPKQCFKKWNEIAILPDFMFPAYTNRTPILPTSYASSPVGGPADGYHPFSITSAA